MSVFHRPKRNREVATAYADGSLIPCKPYHEWEGQVLRVDSSIHEVQFPQYVGKSCSCGKLLWDEGLCGCIVKKWEAKMIPNEG